MKKVELEKRYSESKRIIAELRHEVNRLENLLSKEQTKSFALATELAKHQHRETMGVR